MSELAVHRECFFVGGNYVQSESGLVMRGQVYVEALTPQCLQHTLPIILIHGRDHTAVNWINTPDGRPGWATWYVSRGWKVYLIDQPARGRSAYHHGQDGAQGITSASTIEKVFTAPAEHGAWPQAKLHTQWPGGPNKGHVGDPVFDQYYASLVPSLSRTDSELLMQSAGAALLDRVGPAILVGHSQGGLLSWLIGDSRPELVKGIVAVEPTGPPYKDLVPGLGQGDRLSGLTRMALTYDPPVSLSSPLEFQLQSTALSPERVETWSQKEPARRLVQLSRIPVAIVTAEASYHALFDHGTAHYLTSAGVKTDHILLSEHGIHGNGHIMALEINNLEIASLIETWITSHIKA